MTKNVKSVLVEAIPFGLTRKAQFRRFPEDGRVEIDNNSVHAEATCAYW